jgi:hypothetical protein
MSLSERFAHRHNRDGSHDSICTACAATVASVQDENELGSHESSHACTPGNGYRVIAGRLEFPPSEAP